MVEPAGKVARLPKWFRFVASTVVPLCCVGVLLIVGSALPGTWNGYRGDGIHGTLTVTDEECGRGGCDYYGEFLGDSGRRRVTHARLQGGSHDVGERVPAVLPGRRGSEVFVEGDASKLVTAGFAMVVTTLYLLGWTVWLTRRLRRR